MSQKEKLIKRLKAKPKDFTFDEAVTLLGYFSYSISNKGKTSGSRVSFTSSQGKHIQMHKPHNGNAFKSYQIDQLIEHLETEGLI